MMSLLNLLVTLLFLGSIILVIYCIALFFARESKQAKLKALKLVILPIIYISAVLIYSKYKLIETRKIIIKELTGKYIYIDSLQSQDSILPNTSELNLFGNQTFRFKSSNQSDSTVNGNWGIDDKSTSLQFRNLRGDLMWQGYKRIILKKHFIIFYNSAQKIKFMKVD